MKHSELLTKAKTLLWDGKDSYSDNTSWICSAIEDADYHIYREFSQRSKECREVQTLIDKLINVNDGYPPHYGTFEDWLHRHHPPAAEAYDALDSLFGKEATEAYNSYIIELQSTRHRFVDHLIEYYQQQGL